MNQLETLDTETAEAIGFGLLGKIYGLIISAGKGLAFDAGYGMTKEASAEMKTAMDSIDDIAPDETNVFKDNSAAMAYWLNAAEIVKNKAPKASARQTLGATAKFFIKSLFVAPTNDEIEALANAAGMRYGEVLNNQQLQHQRQIDFQVPLIKKALEFAAKTKPSKKAQPELDIILAQKIKEAFAGARSAAVKTQAPEEALKQVALLNTQEASLA